MKHCRLGLILALSLLCVQASHAANLRFLKNSVLSEFTEEDAESFKAFANDALDTLADQERKDWMSDSEKLKGVIRPLASFEQEGLNCRRTRFGLAGKKHSNAAFVFEMCKVDERWQFRESPLALLKEDDWTSLNAALSFALEQKQQGEKHFWESEAIAVKASIEAFETSQIEGKDCRDAEISVNGAGDKTSSGRFTFCKNNDTWERYVP